VELDWLTFTLEIINFLVLIWILQRFLYQPVLRTIARRKAAIEKTLSDANAAQADAQGLERQYRDRLADWEREKDALHAQAVGDVNAERTRLMAALRDELDQEREKQRVLEQRRLDDLRRQIEEAAVAQGAQFAARLLSRVAAPELDARIVVLVSEDLAHLSEDQVLVLKDACRDAGSTIKVASAFPLDAAQRDGLVRGVGDAVKGQVVAEFSEDPKLLAGLRISIGPWVLRANVQDELKWFSEAAHRGG
jgi:F-type H+-transporting ATPase subunit b